MICNPLSVPSPPKTFNNYEADASELLEKRVEIFLGATRIINKKKYLIFIQKYLIFIQKYLIFIQKYLIFIYLIFQIKVL